MYHVQERRAQGDLSHLKVQDVTIGTIRSRVDTVWGVHFTSRGVLDGVQEETAIKPVS